MVLDIIETAFVKIPNSVSVFLFVLGLVGLLILGIKERKTLFFQILIVSLFPAILWRSVIKITSSRYASGLIYPFIILFLYLVFLAIKKKCFKCLALLLVIILGIWINKNYNFSLNNSNLRTIAEYHEKVNTKEQIGMLFIQQDEVKRIKQMERFNCPFFVSANYPYPPPLHNLQDFICKFKDVERIAYFVLKNEKEYNYILKDDPNKTKPVLSVFTQKNKKKRYQIYRVSSELLFKRVILSFYANKENYLYSPGEVRITPNNVQIHNCTQNPIDDDNELSVTGKRLQIFSPKRIVLSNNTLSSTITIKNVGNTKTRIYLGYAIYTKDMIQINGKNYPYDETVLNVVTSPKGSNSIIVDKYPEWKKNCYLALNAKEDFSDVPNVSFVGGTIVEVKELENGNAEIIMDKPLVSAIEKGSTVRINGFIGSYLYTHSIILRPGEEQTLSSKIQKDYSCHTFSQAYSYSSEVFPKGIDYAAPIVLSYSVDNNVDNTIKIKDFVISY